MQLTSSTATPVPAAAADPAAVPPAAGILRRSGLRDQATVVSAGIALAAILLTAVSGVSYWTMREQAADAEQAQADRARALATSMAPALEALIAQNDLSAVRRIVAETAHLQGLPRCRVVLPNGKVVAAAAGTDRITALTLPQKWSEKQSPVEPDAHVSRIPWSSRHAALPFSRWRRRCQT